MTEVPFGEEWAGESVDGSADQTSADQTSADQTSLDQGMWVDPEDRPWTPIPRQARATESGLIPTQRRLKKTSRSA